MCFSPHPKCGVLVISRIPPEGEHPDTTSTHIHIQTHPHTHTHRDTHRLTQTHTDSLTRWLPRLLTYSLHSLTHSLTPHLGSPGLPWAPLGSLGLPWALLGSPVLSYRGQRLQAGGWIATNKTLSEGKQMSSPKITKSIRFYHHLCARGRPPERP